MRVFLLAGTQEARLLASRLIKKNYVVTASLNGNTRNPKEFLKKSSGNPKESLKEHVRKCKTSAGNPKEI